MHRSGLFQIILAFVSLYSLMGVWGALRLYHRCYAISSHQRTGLSGVAVMVLSMPANALVARCICALRLDSACL